MGTPNPQRLAETDDLPLLIGQMRGRVQQALTMNLAAAVDAGDVPAAQAWRVEIVLPRGVSASEGALLLANLPAGASQRKDAARSLVREAITWHTARVRQLLADATHSTEHADTPLPGRLRERLGEAITLAQLPPALASAAGVDSHNLLDAAAVQTQLNSILHLPWAQTAAPVAALEHEIESHLPSLLSEQERQRREHLLLKLVTVIPTEYRAGVRDGQVTVPLEYREAVSFSAQADEFADELTPLWLSHDQNGKLQPAVDELDRALADADQAIGKK